MVGKRVVHFEVGAKLGEGGMGTVYRAVDTRLNRPVAIKFLSCELADETARRRFQREAQMASSLNHPHILAVYDAGEFEGRQYLVTELVDGGTLTAWAKAEKPSWRRTVELLIDIADGLAAAHAEGITHRDVKPANILVAGNGYPKLVDFGLAKLTEARPDDLTCTLSPDSTRPGMIVGTIAYMSPEQASGGFVDSRSDIFSFGVVLYELLCGRRPFVGTTDHALLQAIIHEPFPPLPEDLPPALRAVVEKSLEKLPDGRYQFIRDLVVDLRLLLRSPVSATTATAEVEVTGSKAVRPLSTSGHILNRRRWIGVAVTSMAAPLLYFGYRTWNAPQRRIESVAILPFENLSGNLEQEYFSDGMTDALIGEIARIGSIRVISRTSIMQYKGRARKPLPEIARELNVDAILEGTVLKSGPKIRITAQLIRAENDGHLWSESYDRDLADVLAIQSEVARAVAGQIQMKLIPHATSPVHSRSADPAAYDAFLHGKYFLGQGLRGVTKSMECFRKSVELDPTQAEAHAGLAEASCYAGIFGFIPSAEAYTGARMSAVKALELDESNAVAHNVLADVKKGYDWDLAGAEVEYKRALQLNPSHLLTRYWYSESLTRMGRFDEAIAESAKALALDPVSPNTHGFRSMIFFRARRYDDAIRSSRQSLDLDPSFANALWWQGLALAAKLDFENSIACFTNAIRISPAPLLKAYLGYVYARAGDRAKALSILAGLAEDSKSRYVSPVDFAVVHSGLVDVDAAFLWLEKAYQSRATRVHELPAPYFDTIRKDSRYASLVRRVGLPE